MAEKCSPRDLYAGTTKIGELFEIHKGENNYNPRKVAGFAPGDGDTHGDQVLEVPECPE